MHSNHSLRRNATEEVFGKSHILKNAMVLRKAVSGSGEEPRSYLAPTEEQGGSAGVGWSDRRADAKNWFSD